MNYDKNKLLKNNVYNKCDKNNKFSIEMYTTNKMFNINIISST